MLIEQLKNIVGPGGWCTEQQDLEPHLTEWRDTWRGATPIMVMPKSAREVAAIVGACGEAGVGIVPQGGNTGLCGGAVPDATGTQVLLSLSRLNRVREISANDYSMTVEAGCILRHAQEEALAVSRFLALSLASEGSCQIGGNLSTNAGGINVLRYGTARDQVLGLEVVLPDGTLWNGLRTLRKDTAGYDIKQLFVGAEGTLGVITAASLKLFPCPADRQVCMLVVASAQAAIDLFAILRDRLADQLQAFELMSGRSIRFVQRHMPRVRSPFDGDHHRWMVLLETTDGDRLERALAETLEDGRIDDAVVAKSAAEQAAFWHIRHSISEAQKFEGSSLKHDISVPVGDVARFIAEAEEAIAVVVAGARVVAFGHVGDGNVHFNVSQPKAMNATDFLSRRDVVARTVYDVVERFNGSISAEHGIGVLKRDQLPRFRSHEELDVMRAIKRTLDPRGIMNPGKVL